MKTAIFIGFLLIVGIHVFRAGKRAGEGERWQEVLDAVCDAGMWACLLMLWYLATK